MTAPTPSARWDLTRARRTAAAVLLMAFYLVRRGIDPRGRHVPARGLVLVLYLVLVAAATVDVIALVDPGRPGAAIATAVGLCAAASAMRPGSIATTAVLVLICTVFSYGVLLGVDVSYADIAVLATLLYTAHAAAAFLAIVPPGAAVDAAVVRRAARRLLEVFALSALIWLVVAQLAAPQQEGLLRFSAYVALVLLVTVSVALVRGRAPWR
jgi:hypothetical protein